MKHLKYSNIQNFLNDYEAILVAEEAVNQLILFNTYMLLKNNDEGALYGAIYLEDDLSLIYIWASPYNIQVKCYANAKEALDVLIDYLISENVLVSGINCTSAEAKYFIEKYCQRINVEYYLHYAMDIMVLTSVNDVKNPNCRFVKVESDKSYLVVKYIEEFSWEIDHEQVNHDDVVNSVNRKIENNRQFGCLNEKGELVSIVNIARTLKKGSSINGVYTPKEQRGKGYATYMISEMSKYLLSKGSEYCTLFVDQNNPISNKVYYNVGYQVIADNYDYRIKK